MEKTQIAEKYQKIERFGISTCQYFSHQNQYQVKEVSSTHKPQIEFCLKTSTFSVFKLLVIFFTQFCMLFKKKSQMSQFKFIQIKINIQTKIFFKEKCFKKNMREIIQIITTKNIVWGSADNANQKNNEDK